MKVGIDVLLEDRRLLDELAGCPVALLGHPASVTRALKHSMDALAESQKVRLSSAFGPQHGMRGEKQDDMIESGDYRDTSLGIPVFSLYGVVRRPTDEMMDTFEILLVDLQDVGCRIYTFLTTLIYMLHAGADKQKQVWILDRPNPAGRPVEGPCLSMEWSSFVGAVPVPMRYGLTIGEIAKWYVHHFKLDVPVRVIPMKDYSPSKAPGFGWPVHELSWVNPSPNIPNLSAARCFPGTVLVEGTNLSEGRGTTVPLQVLGAPRFQSRRVIEELEKFSSDWLGGCRLRPCYFEPTFHKHSGELVSALQIHVDDAAYVHNQFKPYRLVAGLLKMIKKVQPELLCWKEPPYEYEEERLPIDILNGSPFLREWLEDSAATAQDLEERLSADERAWTEIARDFYLYP
ncbi:MAG: exo-beta-N-acetylmuramidase NamZ family protein [Acidobacteriota bacterium]